MVRLMTDIPGKEPIRLFEEQPRWELLPVLAWIVSRDIGQAFRASAKDATMQAVDLALAEFQTAAGEPRCGSVAEAWAGHLVPKLRPDGVFAFATMVRKQQELAQLSKVGDETEPQAFASPEPYGNTTRGVCFPSAGQPGVARSCVIDDSGGHLVVREDIKRFSGPWTEWHDLNFDRQEILAAWPGSCVKSNSVEKAVTSVITKEELEDKYQKRMNEWPEGKTPPTFAQDWDFIKSLKPETSRDRARAIRNDYAPYSWRRPGKKKSSG